MKTRVPLDMEVRAAQVSPDTVLRLSIYHGKRKTKKLLSMDVMVVMMGSQPVVQVSIDSEDPKVVRKPVPIVERVNVCPRSK